MAGIAPLKSESAIATSQRVKLSGIRWNTYLLLLEDMGEHRSSRLSYAHGNLEITMPSNEHETNKKLLERMVEALTEELNRPLKSFGSSTLNREDLQQGAEPDSCYYIDNANKIQNRQIDLEKDPPPDLVLEIDISSPSTQRMQIYARLGVPELWRYSKGQIEILRLETSEYVACDSSPTFAIVTAEVLNRWLEAGKRDDETSWIRGWRRWVREQGGDDPA